MFESYFCIVIIKTTLSSNMQTIFESDHTLASYRCSNVFCIHVKMKLVKLRNFFGKIWYNCMEISNVVDLFIERLWKIKENFVKKTFCFKKKNLHLFTKLNKTSVAINFLSFELYIY